MGLSAIEHTLTKDIRSFLQRYQPQSLKKFAFTVSLISCLCSGSVLLFSLFTPVLQHDLHYSQFQINIIGSFTSLGMYLPLPYLGYLADAHGPVVLAIIAAVFFAPGYIVASIAVQNSLNFWYMAVSFGFIGCATSAIYFTSLLTCTKIYPDSKGLTISGPVTCYGLSSLIGSQVLKLKYLRHHDNELDLYKTFRFFTILYLILGVFNWVSSSVVSIERDIILTKDSNEESPLLENQTNDDSDDMVLNHETKYKNFLKDISTYLLLFSLLGSIGPSEMYITNMGSLVKAISPISSIEDQVSTHAILSTLSRLTLAPLSDVLLSRFKISRVWPLLILLLLGSITQFLVAFGYYNEKDFYIISALSGFTYGGFFTLYPTIVLSIWGSELFGSTWGSFMIAPALGATGFGFFYGVVYDSRCLIEEFSISILDSCVSPVFLATGFSFIFSTLLLFVAWKLIWTKRGISV